MMEADWKLMTVCEASCILRKSFSVRPTRRAPSTSTWRSGKVGGMRTRISMDWSSMGYVAVTSIVRALRILTVISSSSPPPLPPE